MEQLMRQYKLPGYTFFFYLLFCIVTNFSWQLCKSVDWFLYDRDLRHERINTKAKKMWKKRIHLLSDGVYDLEAFCKKKLFYLSFEKQFLGFYV